MRDPSLPHGHFKPLECKGITMMMEIDTIARTAWGEARGCGAAGMHAVINVIVNRADHPSWWGRSLIGVCVQPWQFSCRNAGDPNLAKLEAVTGKDVAFQVALGLASQAVAGTLLDLTDGADSYYALSMHTPPTWARTATKTFADGWHVFYRTVGPFPPGSRPDVRNVAITAADLNDAELRRVKGS